MKAFSFKIKLLLIITLLGLTQFSYANNKDDVSLEQASETIRKETKGQVLSATTNNYNGVKSHRIQVLTESGRVKVYQVPANKKDISKHYGNNENRPNNSNNYRNMKPNTSSTNRNKPTEQNSQSRSRYNRNSFNHNTTTVTSKPNSNGDTKKK